MKKGSKFKTVHLAKFSEARHFKAPLPKLCSLSATANKAR